MISIEHVHKKFGQKEVLKDICCELNTGIYGLLGPNGSGKTTLMRCMTNLYPLSGGKITINGISSKRGSKIGIGYLPQFFGLFKELTVWDSMRYFCNLKHIKKAEEKKVIDFCLEKVNMSDRKKMAGRKLSGGMTFLFWVFNLPCFLSLYLVGGSANVCCRRCFVLAFRFLQSKKTVVFSFGFHISHRLQLSRIISRHGSSIRTCSE